MTAESSLPDRFNIAWWLLHRHVEEGSGERRALICPDRDWSYAELAGDTNRFAGGLAAAGVEPGRRVLLVLPDCAEFVVAYLGAMQAGAVAVPTSTALRPGDYGFFLDESEAEVLVTHSNLWSQIAPAVEGRPVGRVIVVGEPTPGTLQWNEWIAEQTDARLPAPTAADDPAFWLWTSGSTGPPKAAVHRHRDWVHCCRSYARHILEIAPNDRCFSSSKLFHAYGLGNGLAFPFSVGAEAVLEPGRPTPESILRRVQDTRPKLFFSVPTLYGLILHHMDQGSEYDLSSIRLALSAAEPLPGAVYRRWQERFGIEILDGIGSTEALHIYASSRPGKSRADTTGFPVPGYDVRITDENGRRVEAGQVGDLQVRGPSIASCYWNREELTAERMQGDWFLTGDKYWQDKDGYLHYAGRADDMFRVSGQWVSPIEVESALVEHEAVLECAVVPWETDGLTKPKAYVIPTDGAPAEGLARELQDWVKSRITPYKYPRTIEFVDELSKTAAGKIQRFKLRE